MYVVDIDSDAHATCFWWWKSTNKWCIDQSVHKEAGISPSQAVTGVPHPHV